MDELCRLFGEYSTLLVAGSSSETKSVLLTIPFRLLPFASRSLGRPTLCRPSPPRVRWLALEHRPVLKVCWDQRAKTN